MDIKAAVAIAPNKPFKFKTVQLGNPQDNEILVKIKGVGICHTDLVAKAGMLPPPHPLCWAMKDLALWKKSVALFPA